MSSMRHAARVTMLGFAVALVGGCVSTNATLLNAANGPRPAIAPDSVVIYLTAADVHERYDEVALLNSSGSSRYTNEQQMYESMRKKASQLGANGIILDATKDPSGGAQVAAALLGTDAKRKGRAIAIYVHHGETKASADSSSRR